jgi:hypothetical protein
VSIFSSRLVKRRRDGRFDLAIGDLERQLLRTYLEQLRDLLLGDDPLLRRLFPPAYLQDDDRDKDYQALMKGDLIESRFAAIETMEATLDERTVDEASLTRWMQAINSLRLVVGTRLDVSEVPEPLDTDDPDRGLYQLYEILGWLLAHIVEALSEALPPPTDDGPELPDWPSSLMDPD